jgi:hypothetical protein
VLQKWNFRESGHDLRAAFLFQSESAPGLVLVIVIQQNRLHVGQLETHRLDISFNLIDGVRESRTEKDVSLR